MTWLLYIVMLDPSGHVQRIAPWHYQTQTECEFGKIGMTQVKDQNAMAGWTIKSLRCEGVKK